MSHTRNQANTREYSRFSTVEKIYGIPRRKYGKIRKKNSREEKKVPDCVAIPIVEVIGAIISVRTLNSRA
jgi:hypothetical protein